MEEGGNKTGGRRRTGRRSLWLPGLLLGVLALLLAGTGLVLDLDWHRRDVQASGRSDAVLEKLEERFGLPAAAGGEALPGTGSPGKGETGEAKPSEEETGSFLESAPQTPETTASDAVIPEEMPWVSIGTAIPGTGETMDIRYLGILTIPALDLKLPVILSDEWVPERMDIAPCTYSGSLKTRDLVIMAHNYAAHFLGILNMQAGQEVFLQTADGMLYRYTVTAVDVMHRSQKEKLYEGEWDLTLFTCVPQTYNRCAVRCALVSATGKYFK